MKITILLIIFTLPAFRLPIEGEVISLQKNDLSIQLIPEKDEIILGEPIYVNFVVNNLTEHDLYVLEGGDYRNNLGRPESFIVRTIRADGVEVPQPTVSFSEGGLYGPKTVPAMGKYEFKLFLPRWAVFETSGVYKITAKKTLDFTASREGWSDLSPNERVTNRLEATADARLIVLKYDSERIGKLIDTLGSGMLKELPSRSESIETKLRTIEDVRVIPYLLDALQNGNYSTKFNAISALGKYDHKSAFEGLKSGLEFRSGDFISHSTRLSVAESLANNIHNAAAGAISRSPFPEAIPFLISQRNHPTYSVRLTVAHALGKMAPEYAVPILEGMREDSNSMVRGEVLRYLNEFNSKQN